MLLQIHSFPVVNFSKHFHWGIYIQNGIADWFNPVDVREKIAKLNIYSKILLKHIFQIFWDVNGFIALIECPGVFYERLLYTTNKISDIKNHSGKQKVQG